MLPRIGAEKAIEGVDKTDSDNDTPHLQSQPSDNDNA